MRTLLFSIVIALAPAGCSKDKADKADQVEHVDVPEISIEDASAGLAANQLTMVDCNSVKTRQKVGIIPGAILIDDEEKFPASVLPSDKTAKLVFYCGGPG